MKYILRIGVNCNTEEAHDFLYGLRRIFPLHLTSAETSGINDCYIWFKGHLDENPKGQLNCVIQNAQNKNIKISASIDQIDRIFEV